MTTTQQQIEAIRKAWTTDSPRAHHDAFVIDATLDGEAFRMCIHAANLQQAGSTVRTLERLYPNLQVQALR